MDAAKQLSPRKKPRQERSQATVEAILQAATYILQEDGWSKLTTNRVAERAGVNIASLYQYFPNKEAIVAELHKQHITRSQQRCSRLATLYQESELEAATNIGSIPEEHLRGIIWRSIASITTEHAHTLALHQAAEALSVNITQEKHAESMDIQRAWLLPLLKNTPDPEMTFFLLHTSVRAALHRASKEQPQLLHSPLFIDELTTLVMGLVRRA